MRDERYVDMQFLIEILYLIADVSYLNNPHQYKKKWGESNHFLWTKSSINP